MSEEEKEAKREYQRTRYGNMKKKKKKKKKKTSQKNIKQLKYSKQAIDLNLADINKIVISDKFKHSDNGFTYFTGNKDDNIVRPLCIILPQMSGCIKYFGNGGNNMSFMIEDDSVLVKYNEIWNKIKKT